MLLRDKDREKLITIFSGVDTAFEVWAYGSRVNGDAHEGSDLDLVIRTPDLRKMPVDVLSPPQIIQIKRHFAQPDACGIENGVGQCRGYGGQSGFSHAFDRTATFGEDVYHHLR